MGRENYLPIWRSWWTGKSYWKFLRNILLVTNKIAHILRNLKRKKDGLQTLKLQKGLKTTASGRKTKKIKILKNALSNYCEKATPFNWNWSCFWIISCFFFRNKMNKMHLYRLSSIITIVYYSILNFFWKW